MQSLFRPGALKLLPYSQPLPVGWLIFVGALHTAVYLFFNCGAKNDSDSATEPLSFLQTTGQGVALEGNQPLLFI